MARLGESKEAQLMRLESAKLCSCDSLYTGRTCPVCASDQFLWLENILGRVSDGAASSAECGGDPLPVLPVG